MKTFLLPHLICPACLPKEHRLTASIAREQDADIITGTLCCNKCARRFPIKEGLALLVADPEGFSARGHWRYEEPDTVNRYLWSHYADLHGDDGNLAATAAWADCLAEGASSALEAG